MTAAQAGWKVGEQLVADLQQFVERHGLLRHAYELIGKCGADVDLVREEDLMNGSIVASQVGDEALSKETR